MIGLATDLTGLIVKDNDRHGIAAVGLASVPVNSPCKLFRVDFLCAVIAKIHPYNCAAFGRFLHESAALWCGCGVVVLRFVISSL